MKKDKRDVLKGLAVGSVWATPAVSSVMLPAHAALSVCCTDRETSQSSEDIEIVFDGTVCSTRIFSEGDVSANAVIGFDTDIVENLLWDDIGTGTNWSRGNTDIPSQDDNSNGTYFLEISNGSTYRVRFTIEVSGTIGEDGVISLSDICIELIGSD